MMLNRYLLKSSKQILTRLVICILLINIILPLNAQLEYKTGSIDGFSVSSWYEISIDSLLIDKLVSLPHPKDAGFQFAIPVGTDLTPLNSGSIYEKETEDVWIIGIRSKNARSLNLMLEPFRIPQGSFVYIYNSDKSVIRGAFTYENINPSGILPTMPVPGEELVLEYHFPKGKSIAGTIGITQVAHDYLGILGTESKDSRYNQSQPCNVDINCQDGNGFENERRSVCRIIIRGIELCSGVLLNNTSQQNQPLLATAQHCIVNQDDANRSVFVFGYESPWCDGPDGRVSHSLSGSLLRSTNDNIDFSLVELNEFPPLTYRPYFAGWDVTGNIPQYSATIHHPQGDVKKISKDLDPPASSTFKDFLPGSFWQILRWDTGTTEGGSSGAPLFDQDKRVIGLLSGGEAVCGRSVNDYYAKFSISYNLSNLLWQQLKGWIDPAQSGLKILNGRDPYSPNWVESDTLYNILDTETPVITEYELPDRGYSTGFNSDSIVAYAEYFSNPRNLKIVEAVFTTAKAISVNAYDSVTVYIYDDGPMPSGVIASQKILIKETKDLFPLHVDFINPVEPDGNFYAGWQLWYQDKAIDETRQFAVFHAPDRFSPAANTAWFNNGSGWKEFPEHPFDPVSTSLDVMIIGIADPVINKQDDIPWKDDSFITYPNPARDILTVASEIHTAQVNYSIINLAGIVCLHGKVTGSCPGIFNIDLTGLKEGMYLLELDTGERIESHKVLIVN